MILLLLIYVHTVYDCAMCHRNLKLWFQTPG